MERKLGVSKHIIRERVQELGKRRVSPSVDFAIPLFIVVEILFLVLGSPSLERWKENKKIRIEDSKNRL